MTTGPKTDLILIIILVFLTFAVAGPAKADTCTQSGNRTVCTYDNGESRTCITNGNSTYCSET